MKQVFTRVGAVIGAATLASMAASPALAAETVAQAEANALTLSIAGEAASSGTVTASHDGDTLTKDGQTAPPVSVLQGQDLLNVGVLAQDATAGVDGLVGVSAACAGVAGQGGSVASIGESSCIVPGDDIGVNLANLDLSGEFDTIDPASALGPLQDVLVEPLETEVIGPLTAALSTNLSENLGPLADLNIGGSIGAVEARCTATPGEASGTANIVDGSLSATLGGQTIELVQLPVSPAPNTKVVTDLDAVLNAVIEGLETDLEETVDAALGDLVVVTDEIQAQIVNTIVNDVSAQLAPLEDNLLDITLNEQTRPAEGHIEVTAIDLRAIPGAAEALGAPLVHAEIANVACGPNSRIAPVVEEDDPAPGGNDGGDLPSVPTVVDSGVSGGTGGSAADLLIGGSLVLTALAGLVGYRRLTAAV